LNVSSPPRRRDKRVYIPEEVQKWLDLIRVRSCDQHRQLKLAHRSPDALLDVRLLNYFAYILVLPSVASCHAMRNLLASRQNASTRLPDSCCGRSPAGIVWPRCRRCWTRWTPSQNQDDYPSCGKLTTGVTIRPWTGSHAPQHLSPETYFQAAFRVQSPWTVKTRTELPKRRANYQRGLLRLRFRAGPALRQIAEYSCRLNVDESDPEKKVEEFISFLPVLAYDGSSMKQIDAAGILDMP